MPPIVLVHGADAQSLDDTLAAVTRALFTNPSSTAFDREVFDGRETDPEAIVTAALTLPLAAPRRLVAVRRAQAVPARAAEALARYVAAPNPSACLLLLADEALHPSRDRRTAHWLLGVVPPAAVVAPALRRGRAVEEWLRARVQVEGLTIGADAARLLVQWVGDDGATLLAEARKAALAGGPDNCAVGVKEVEAVVGEHKVSGVFDLTRAIERREVGLALRTLERLLATEDPMPVLVMLTREVRTAWSVREWHAAGQSVEQMARRLGRPPAVVQAVVTTAAGQSPAALARKLALCWHAERRLKSGGEARAEMTALVAELARRG
ncbi:MAG TPA: DNA polymerase III subunit delta [Methylomirabilota bacterium]|nr:DNA polymerase III subunit delta [Methylomirabilota bacterium]